MQEIATAASYRGRSSVQKFFNAEYNPPALDMVVAGRLARAFVGHGKPPIEEGEIFELTSARKNELDRYQFKQMSSLTRDIPVYSAQFAFSKKLKSADNFEVATYMLELDNPIRYAWHPPCYNGRAGIYALFIFGQPLTPRYRSGDTVFVDDAEPARLGDDVCAHIVEFEGGDLFEEVERADTKLGSSALAIFGVFERQEGDRIWVRSFDGSSLIQLSLAKLKNLTRLLTLSDAMVPAYAGD